MGASFPSDTRFIRLALGLTWVKFPDVAEKDTKEAFLERLAPDSFPASRSRSMLYSDRVIPITGGCEAAD